MSNRTKILSTIAAVLGLGTIVSAGFDRRAIKKYIEQEAEAGNAEEVYDPASPEI